MNKQWRRAGWAIVAAGLLAGSLSACVPLLVGGSAVTGVLVASDRRTTGMYIEDESIEQKTTSALRDLVVKTGVRVNVTSFNRLVLLTGEVHTEAEKAEAGRIASAIANVRNVVNELEVVPFIASVTQRSKDTFITSKVKASLIDAKDLQANSIKVVTEMNVVYLMGIVTPREAKRAAEIARGVNGVSKVVRVFENISEDELANYQKRQEPAAPVEDGLSPQ